MRYTLLGLFFGNNLVTKNTKMGLALFVSLKQHVKFSRLCVRKFDI